jgi:hypothetical protein
VSWLRPTGGGARIALAAVSWQRIEEVGVVMDRATKTLVIVWAASVTTSACAQLFGVVWASRLGFIQPDSAVVPDSVAAGVGFTVAVQTSGGGCNRAGNTVVLMVDAHTAEVRPYDEYEVNPPDCTTNILLFHHSATVQFDQTGTGIVRVIGAYNDSTITITHSVDIH